MKILVGADPELFLEKDGGFYSAYGMVPGTKAAPHPVDGGAVQVDGMALEFNIKPAESADEFVHSIGHVLSQLRAMVPGDFKFSDAVTAQFSPEHMKIQPPEAIRLGCDPDFDAYREAVNNRKINPKNKRVAGGHVHIGWTNNENPMEYSHFLSCCQLARQLDYFLGMPSTLLDTDTERRQQYGLPGSFRPKPYGMEYRTLSNFWIHKKEWTKLVYNQTVKAFNLLVDEDKDYHQMYGNMAHDTIQYGDQNWLIAQLAKIPEIMAGTGIDMFATKKSSMAFLTATGGGTAGGVQKLPRIAANGDVEWR